MTQQTEMFTRLALAGTVPMTPNANGLFTVDQVAVLASKRACSIKKAGDYSIEIKHPGQGRGQWKHASIMATDKGLWSPVQIFRACREAAGQKHYEVNQATAKIKNPGGLNEVLIAEIVGADGVRPYLSRPGKYHFQSDAHGNGFYHNPAFAATRRLIIGGINVHFDHGVPKVGTGDWTWPLFAIMCGGLSDAGKSYDYRRAVRALDDAGLLRLRVGPRGGFGTATFEWLPLADLALIERKETLHHADSEFMTDLMAVS